MSNHHTYDVIIIGGSYAGLSAAMSLGRSLKNVLIIDSGMPCNRQTPHSHNFLTQDGETPSAIAAKGMNQVLTYDTVKFHQGKVVKGQKATTGFKVETSKGESFSALKLIFATGIEDLLPDRKGFAECWGISVIHCPYCHGYEFRKRKTGILARGERAFHLASLVKNLTNDLTLLESAKTALTSFQLQKLKEKNIQLMDKEVIELVHEKGKLTKVIFNDYSEMDFDAIYAAVPFRQHSTIPEELGCELTEQGYLKVNHFQQTSVPGIFACGDNCSMMRSVVNAVATGSLAGAMVNKELTEEHF